MSIFSKNQTKKVVVNAENHGYKPDIVTFKQGKPAQLKFISSDNMGCMNEVVSKDLNFDEKLDGKKEVTVKEKSAPDMVPCNCLPDKEHVC